MLKEPPLGAGYDGQVFKAKIKFEDEDSVTGKRLATIKLYVCIKKFNHNYGKDKNEEIYGKK